MKSTLAIVEINNVNFMIHASNHALKRMAQRNINKYAISGSIIALGKHALVSIQESKDQAILIDEHRGISIVFAVRNYRISIITVINKSNVFVKKNTKIVKL